MAELELAKPVRRFDLEADLLAWRPHDGREARARDTGSTWRYFAESGWVRQTDHGEVVTLVATLVPTTTPSQLYIRAYDPAAGDGNEGDGWINSVTGNLLSKVAGAWVVIGNIIGPTGPSGPIGQVGLAMAIVFGAP